ncbi:MAG: SUMF1/EgtB/PvdO family nonheme iron enzyme [Candidatus Aminicenantes bacterium]|nr:SUMF1/EgtB/PvdO family nonheme iron enzyme [Candidatus Aminicenantes bacterium]
MKQNNVYFNVFIAALDDGKYERQIVHDICTELSDDPLVSKDDIRFKAVGWEAAALGAAGPQEIIKRLVEKCDIFVCILHRKFAASNGEQESDALEKILCAYSDWEVQKKIHVMLYFKEINIKSITELEDEQLRKVLKFKEEIEKNHLFYYDTFSDPDRFRVKFKEHIKRWLKTNISSRKSPADPHKTSAIEKGIKFEIFYKYKQYALNEHRHLPMKGFETNLRAPIEIEQVYIAMRAHIKFYDFDLTMEGKQKIKERIEREQLSDLDIKASFQAAQKRNIKDIVILGEPGSGKTTLLKYILIMMIENKGGEKLGIENDLIPFFAPLRELEDPDEESFIDFISRVCCIEKHRVNKEDFKYLLEHKMGIILLDGLDEIADEKIRIKTCKWIDAARKEFVGTPFVITSRFHGYLGDSRLEGSVLELSILDFTPQEVRSFLIRWFETVQVALHPGDSNEEIWREKGREEALKLFKNIEEAEHIKKLAVNPLMLQIIALIRLDRGTKLPERRVELYNECVDVLLEKWDIARELDTILSAKESRMILQPLALWLHEKEGRRSALLSDIIEQIKKPLESLGKSNIDPWKLLLNIRDRSGIFMGYSSTEYGFAHLGFQEYLAAEEIRNKQRLDLLIDNYGNRWWREVTLMALSLDNPSIISPFMEQIVQKDVFKTDITLVCDSVNDSLIKPYEPFINVLHDDDLAIAARQNAIRVLTRMKGNKAAAALKEVVRFANLVLANAAYNALESLHAADGVEPPEKEKAPAIIKIEKDLSEMALIPEGNFIYGAREDDKEARQDEKPQQTIFLLSFFMDVYAVTNRQYCIFLNLVKPAKEKLSNWIDLSGEYEDLYGKEKCRISAKGRDYQVEPGYEEHPVIYVSWYGAEAYSQWAGKRLPYEVEWEKAARGTDGRKYPWGNEFDKNLCNSSQGGIKHTMPVTTFPEGRSPYGCFNIIGNVWEWCADRFDDNNDKTGTRLKGAINGHDRVLRGGSWGTGAIGCRASFRDGFHPATPWHACGFRLARDL